MSQRRNREYAAPVMIPCEIAAELLAISPLDVGRLVDEGELPRFELDDTGRELLPLRQVQRLAVERSARLRSWTLQPHHAGE